MTQNTGDLSRTAKVTVTSMSAPAPGVPSVVTGTAIYQLTQLGTTGGTAGGDVEITIEPATAAIEVTSMG